MYSTQNSTIAINFLCWTKYRFLNANNAQFIRVWTFDSECLESAVKTVHNGRQIDRVASCLPEKREPVCIRAVVVRCQGILLKLLGTFIVMWHASKPTAALQPVYLFKFQCSKRTLPMGLLLLSLTLTRKSSHVFAKQLPMLFYSVAEFKVPGWNTHYAWETHAAYSVWSDTGSLKLGSILMLWHETRALLKLALCYCRLRQQFVSRYRYSIYISGIQLAFQLQTSRYTAGLLSVS